MEKWCNHRGTVQCLFRLTNRPWYLRCQAFLAWISCCGYSLLRWTFLLCSKKNKRYLFTFFTGTFTWSPSFADNVLKFIRDVGCCRILTQSLALLKNEKKIESYSLFRHLYILVYGFSPCLNVGRPLIADYILHRVSI